MKLVEKNSTIRLMVATAAMAGLLTMGAVAQDAGFGNDIPLGAAVQQIVPQGNTVQLGTGVDRNVRVSWTGDGGWRRAVEQAAADAGYTVAYDGTVVVIKAGAAANNPAPAVPVAETSKPEAPVAPRAAAPAPRPQAATTPAPRPAQQPPRPSVQQMPVVSGGGFVLIPESQVASAGGGEGWKDYGGQRPPTAPVAATWQVSAGDDLNLILTEWAAKEGWRVRWESEYVYTLQSPARFSGDFVTAATELLRGMQDARPVVTAQFFEGNKILVVGNGSLDAVN